MEEGLLKGRGDRADYRFGCGALGWDSVSVVRWRATEALGRPFELEVTALRTRSAGPIDLEPLLDQPATLRIASESRWRPLHGVIVGAEELERTRTLHLYRFVVAPPSFRMTQRVRYRTFVDQRLREVLVALLENRCMAAPAGKGGLAAVGEVPPPREVPVFEAYAAPVGAYRFAVNVPDRLDDPALRSYVVQYGESDLDLFHRLLEEEGLTYFFEHGEEHVCLTIVDRPGRVSPFGREHSARLRTDQRGTGVLEQETLSSLTVGHRMLWGATTATDWDPARPLGARRALALEESSGGGRGAQDDPARFARDLYPSRDAHVGEPCIVPATLAVERRVAERALRRGRSNVRALEPGLKLTVDDEVGVHADSALVIVAVTTFATELAPEGTSLDHEAFGLGGRGHDGPRYENEFFALPEEVPYRPPLVTSRPLVAGVHTAVVSAEEIVGAPPEIHKNDENCVRLRFPWDERVEPGRPSSSWVRVSQGWAGAGYGQVFIPRVGQEVLVAYVAGDPERPLVVGRVYNAVQPAPYTKPTVSTIKSKSSPDDDGFNELRFDDEAGNEEVYLQAEKNLNELVKASHSTSVGGDQSSSVGGNQSNSVSGSQSNTVKGSRTHTVGAGEMNEIRADRVTVVHGDEVYAIVGDLTTGIGGSEQRGVAGSRKTTIEGSDTRAVGANATLNVGALRSTTVGGSESRTVAGMDSVTVGARVVQVNGPHAMTSGGKTSVTAPVVVADGGGASLTLLPGLASLTNGAGATIALVGSAIVIEASSILLRSGGATINMTGDIAANAGTIKLNG